MSNVSPSRSDWISRVVVASPKEPDDVRALGVRDVHLVRAVGEVFVQLGETQHRSLRGCSKKRLHSRKQAHLGLLDRDALVEPTRHVVAEHRAVERHMGKLMDEHHLEVRRLPGLGCRHREEDEAPMRVSDAGGVVWRRCADRGHRTHLPRVSRNANDEVVIDDGAEVALDLGPMLVETLDELGDAASLRFGKCPSDRANALGFVPVQRRG
ncbi:MAG: hypothetical protein JRF42_09000 [Deltaproteobacteria bacterium]|nr:hypothetical protein [Deltaproteobacteria bacterium]